MIDNETYKKEVIRMVDSMRDAKFHGRSNCVGLKCIDGLCPFVDLCGETFVFNAPEMVERVEKWSKEHPMLTNRGVLMNTLDEKFDIKVKVDSLRGCRLIDCDVEQDSFSVDEDPCDNCKYKNFWDQPYQPKR